MAAITYEHITVVGSIKASVDDSKLKFVDYWIEDPDVALATGATISAEALGVSKIRGVLGITAVDANSWVPVSFTAVTMHFEGRARAASYAGGSAEPSGEDVADDNDGLILSSEMNGYAACWIQLLVEV